MAHGKDFIPNPDAEFDNWLWTLLQALQADPSRYGLAGPEISPLQLAHVSWQANYNAHLNAQNAAEGASALKDNTRNNAVSIIRTLARKIQANPSVSDDAKKDAGLPVRDTEKTPVGTPTTRPIGEVDTSERLRHTIHFKDPDSPRKAKPKGVMGCEIWAKTGGPAPTDPTECQFVALDTNSPYLNQFTGADAGKTVHYILRWISSRGEKGPWSETISATIPA